MEIVEVNGEPLIVLTKPAFIALSETLRDIVSRADASQYARDQYTDFINRVREANRTL